MHKKFKKGDKISIEQRFRVMKILQQPFLNKYKEPILVHSTPNSKLFRKILRDHILKVPENTSKINHSYIEKLKGIYPCIFLSLGFAYASAYDFKYSFIFSLNYLKKAPYYRNSISYQCYKRIIQYLDKNNPEILKQLEKKNKTCKAVMNKFYNEEYGGKKRVLFDFWKIEKETFELINTYNDKGKISKIIDEVLKEKLVKYPHSKKIAKKDCLTDAVPEIIVKKNISLINDKDFLGFYIKGDIPKDIKKILLNDYSDKILYDGKKIIQVKELQGGKLKDK